MSTVFINSYMHKGAEVWYLAGGAPMPIAAYQPIGAAGLAASYENLVDTFDASPGVAPTFDAARGWIGDGTQYLQFGDLTTTAFVQNTGVFSIFARIKLLDYAEDRVHSIIGSTVTSNEKGFGIWYENRSSQGSPKSVKLLIGRGTPVASAHSASNAITDNNSHVVGFVGDGSNFQAWVDGVKSGEAAARSGALSSGNSTRICLLIAANYTTPFSPMIGDYAATALYDATLSDAQAEAVSAAMAAL
jgi:hypothetical protein